jgi:very-short-patch-repair endonuclease
MSRGGVDRLIEQLQEVVAGSVALSMDYAPRDLGSPIERLFFRALTNLIEIGGGWAFSDWHRVDGLFIEKGRLCDESALGIGLQVQVLDWPVDFLITVEGEDGVLRTAVVECDGHDFHERTKEQARRDRSRDRRLQQAGHRVFRFTGSEIYRDPLGCATEIIRWATDMAGDGCVLDVQP